MRRSRSAQLLLLPVMEESLPQSTSRVSERTQSNNKMSILAMSQPTTPSAFKRHYAWEDSRQSDFASRAPERARAGALPSIRQVSLFCRYSDWTRNIGD